MKGPFLQLGVQSKQVLINPMILFSAVIEQEWKNWIMCEEALPCLCPDTFVCNHVRGIKTILKNIFLKKKKAF